MAPVISASLFPSYILLEGTAPVTVKGFAVISAVIPDGCANVYLAASRPVKTIPVIETDLLDPTSSVSKFASAPEKSNETTSLPTVPTRVAPPVFIAVKVDPSYSLSSARIPVIVNSFFETSIDTVLETVL